MYPFNRGIYKGKTMTINAFGGDIAYGDIMYFTVNTDCTFTTVDPSAITYTRQSTGAFDS